MNISELTLLDLSNILEWFHELPDEKKNSREHVRCMEKIKGIFLIHEDRFEPLASNLVSTTLGELENSDNETLLMSESLLRNRLNRISTLIEDLQENQHKRIEILENEKRSVETCIELTKVEIREEIHALSHEKKKIQDALQRVSEKISEAEN